MKYCCSVCDKQFVWSKETSYYGKLEYKLKSQGPEAYFCSKECLNKYTPKK